MKILIASDIHGNFEKFNKVMDFFQSEQLDKMILLGDTFTLYSAGSVSDRSVANLIWSIADKVSICRGNSDSSYGEELLPVQFVDFYKISLGHRLMCCYHGHTYLANKNSFNIICLGHSHIASIKQIEGITYVNPGSVGRPRDYTIGSFAVLNESFITIYDLDYNVLEEITF